MRQQQAKQERIFELCADCMGQETFLNCQLAEVKCHPAFHDESLFWVLLVIFLSTKLIIRRFVDVFDICLACTQQFNFKIDKYCFACFKSPAFTSLFRSHIRLRELSPCARAPRCQLIFLHQTLLFRSGLPRQPFYPSVVFFF